jgi:hypothetical protein
MNTLPTRRVILDKSFLQGESRNGHRLQLLADSGATFVLTDTLIYEFCTDSQPTQWPATQRKLFPFADKIEVWHHASDLLRLEIAQQRPVDFPIDREATERVREWFRGGAIHVPSNLAALGQAAHQEREVDSVNALIADCRSFCQVDPNYTTRVQRGGAEAEAILSDLMAQHEFIAWRVRKDHGDPTDTELYIRGAEQGLGPEWFAYQHAKSTLALCCHYMLRYGLKNTSAEEFVHTKLDADYVTLLHYADVLATNETKSLAEICRWMHGSSKLILSTGSLDKANPKDDDTRVEAYNKWEQGGRTHGHDQFDWFWAKAELIWRGANLS